MRIIAGAPSAVAGGPPVVLLTIDAKPQVMEGDFGWGKGNLKGAALAKAILLAVNMQEDRANKLHRRFLWRTVNNWPADKPFTISGEEVWAIVAEIEATAEIAAREAATVARERPPVENEGGYGAGGVAFSPVENKG